MAKNPSKPRIQHFNRYQRRLVIPEMHFVLPSGFEKGDADAIAKSMKDSIAAEIYRVIRNEIQKEQQLAKREPQP